MDDRSKLFPRGKTLKKSWDQSVISKNKYVIVSSNELRNIIEVTEIEIN